MHGITVYAFQSTETFLKSIDSQTATDPTFNPSLRTSSQFAANQNEKCVRLLLSQATRKRQIGQAPQNRTNVPRHKDLSCMTWHSTRPFLSSAGDDACSATVAWPATYHDDGPAPHPGPHPNTTLYTYRFCIFVFFRAPVLYPVPGPPGLHKYKLSRGVPGACPGVSRAAPVTVSRGVPGSVVPGHFLHISLLGLHSRRPFGPSFPRVWLLSWGRSGLQRLDSPRGRRDMSSPGS